MGRYRLNNQIGVTVATGGDNGQSCNISDEQWHLTVSAMDNDETIGDCRLMDAAMDFDKEVMRQQWQKL